MSKRPFVGFDDILELASEQAGDQDGGVDDGEEGADLDRGCSCS